MDFKSISSEAVCSALEVSVWDEYSAYGENPSSKIKRLVTESFGSMLNANPELNYDYDSCIAPMIAQVVCEVAMSNVIKYDLVDWVIDETRFLRNSGLDKFGMDIGIIGTLWGELPTIPPIHEEESRPQIICYPYPPKDSVVLVFGLATKEVVKEYTCNGQFFGFNHLIPFKSKHYNNVENMPLRHNTIKVPSDLKKYL